MSTPADTVNGGARQPRNNKKSNASTKNQASPTTHIANSQPISFDGTVEHMPHNQNRRPRKQTNPLTQNAQNGEQGTPNDNNTRTHQRAPSQPHPASSAVQVTPSKAAAAYAGPTFHASPAPSSLPMPRMFSKSVSDSTSSLPSTIIAEDSDTGNADVDNRQGSKSMTPDPKAREPSPLDFLFDAARQARSSSSQSQTPILGSRNLTPSEERTPTHGRSTPTATLFPFELDGSSEVTSSIGPSFATPYQERLSALRARETPGQASQASLDESERQVKAEALKKLLGHQPSPPPRYPMSDSPRPTTQRHSSGPTATNYASPTPNHSYYPPGLPPQSDSPFRDIPVQRPTSSRLRHQISPGVTENHGYTAPHEPPSPSRTPRAPVDTKKMENDLRRVLKLDTTE